MENYSTVGLGLQKYSQGNAIYLMHDGRAQSYNEAIMLHGGEGTNSRKNFIDLSLNEKEKLFKFLDSL